MTETQQKTEPKLSKSFRKAVTGVSHKEAQEMQTPLLAEAQRGKPPVSQQQTTIQEQPKLVTATVEPLPSQTGKRYLVWAGAVAGGVVLVVLTKGNVFATPFALIAAIALNSSLVSSLYQISHPVTYMATLPSIFLHKHKSLAPLFVAATLNQLVLLALCFVYFKFLIAIGAYVLGLVIWLMLDRILGRLKWFGVYVYPVLVLILTIVAFSQKP